MATAYRQNQKTNERGNRNQPQRNKRLKSRSLNTAMTMQVGIFRTKTIAIHFEEIPNTKTAVVIAIIYNYVI